MKILTLLIGSVPLVALVMCVYLTLHGHELPAPAWVLAGGCVTALLNPPKPGETIGGAPPPQIGATAQGRNQ